MSPQIKKVLVNPDWLYMQEVFPDLLKLMMHRQQRRF